MRKLALHAALAIGVATIAYRITSIPPTVDCEATEHLPNECADYSLIERANGRQLLVCNVPGKAKFVGHNLIPSRDTVASTTIGPHKELRVVSIGVRGRPIIGTATWGGMVLVVPDEAQDTDAACKVAVQLQAIKEQLPDWLSPHLSRLLPAQVIVGNVPLALRRQNPSGSALRNGNFLCQDVHGRYNLDDAVWLLVMRCIGRVLGTEDDNHLAAFASALRSAVMRSDDSRLFAADEQAVVVAQADLPRLRKVEDRTVQLCEGVGHTLGRVWVARHQEQFKTLRTMSDRAAKQLLQFVQGELVQMMRPASASPARASSLGHGMLAQKETSLRLTLASTYFGFMEDCGCKGPPQGGIIRLVQAFADIESDYRIVAGNMLAAEYMPRFDRTLSGVALKELLEVADMFVPGQSEIEYLLKGGTAAIDSHLIAKLGALNINIPGTATRKSGIRTFRTKHGDDVWVCGMWSLGTLGSRRALARRIIESCEYERPVDALARIQSDISKGGPCIVVVVGALTLVDIRQMCAVLPACYISSDPRYVWNGSDRVRDVEKCGEAGSVIGAVHSYQYGYTELTIGARVQVDKHLAAHVLTGRADETKGAARRLIKALEEVDVTEEHVDVHRKGEVSHGSRQPYAGAVQCKQCHSTQYQKWSDSPHAKAMETLGKVQRQRAAHCVICHVTGYNDPGGYQGKQPSDSDNAHVGCEACHGPAGQHVLSLGQTKPPTPKPDVGVCVACHNDEHSRLPRMPSMYMNKASVLCKE